MARPKQGRDRELLACLNPWRAADVKAIEDGEEPVNSLCYNEKV